MQLLSRNPSFQDQAFSPEVPGLRREVVSRWLCTPIRSSFYSSKVSANFLQNSQMCNARYLETTRDKLPPISWLEFQAQSLIDFALHAWTRPRERHQWNKLFCNRRCSRATCFESVIFVSKLNVCRSILVAKPLCMFSHSKPSKNGRKERKEPRPFMRTSAFASTLVIYHQSPFWNNCTGHVDLILSSKSRI